MIAPIEFIIEHNPKVFIHIYFFNTVIHNITRLMLVFTKVNDKFFSLIDIEYTISIFTVPDKTVKFIWKCTQSVSLVVYYIIYINLNECCIKEIKFWQKMLHFWISDMFLLHTTLITSFVVTQVPPVLVLLFVMMLMSLINCGLYMKVSEVPLGWSLIQFCSLWVLSFYLPRALKLVFTDRQSAARIVETGSMNLKLQKLDINIFSTCLRNIRLEHWMDS